METWISNSSSTSISETYLQKHYMGILSVFELYDLSIWIFVGRFFLASSYSRDRVFRSYPRTVTDPRGQRRISGCPNALGKREHCSILLLPTPISDKWMIIVESQFFEARGNLIILFLMLKQFSKPPYRKPHLCNKLPLILLRYCKKHDSLICFFDL